MDSNESLVSLSCMQNRDCAIGTNDLLTSLRGALLLLSSAGPDKGSCYHPNFLRGQPELAREIRRITVKGTGPRRPNNPEEEPNFYALPFLPKSPNGAKSMPAVRAEHEPQAQTLSLSNMGGITRNGAESLLGLGNSSLLAQLGSLQSGPFSNTSQYLPHNSMPSNLLAPAVQNTMHDYGNVWANASDQRSGLINSLTAGSGGWPNIPLFSDQLSDISRTALVRELMLRQQLSAFPSGTSSFLPAAAAATGTASRLEGLASHHHSALGSTNASHFAMHDTMNLPSPTAPPMSSELIHHFLRRQIERDSTADQASSTGGSHGGTTANHPNFTSL
jgi:hypothetical protein